MEKLLYGAKWKFTYLWHTHMIHVLLLSFKQKLTGPEEGLNNLLNSTLNFFLIVYRKFPSIVTKIHSSYLYLYLNLSSYFWVFICCYLWLWIYIQLQLWLSLWLWIHIWISFGFFLLFDFWIRIIFFLSLYLSLSWF